jgi:hypothetical protein
MITNFLLAFLNECRFKYLEAGLLLTKFKKKKVRRLHAQLAA